MTSGFEVVRPSSATVTMTLSFRGPPPGDAPPAGSPPPFAELLSLSCSQPNAGKRCWAPRCGASPTRTFHQNVHYCTCKAQPLNCRADAGSGALIIKCKCMRNLKT